MNNEASQLTETQMQFLRTFLTQAGENAIGKTFDLIRHENRKYARWRQIDIAVNMSDEDLCALARLGYLRLYLDPPAIVFTEKVAKGPSNEVEDRREISDIEETPARHKVLQMDIIQVYAWLIASLIAAMFSLYLLWLTIQQVLAQNISISIASGSTTVISSLLTALFFRNYDKANQHLKHMRSKPPHIEQQETDK